MPCSSKKRCAAYLSSQSRIVSGPGEQHERAERVAVLGEQPVVEVGERHDQPHVVQLDQRAQRVE